MKIRDALQRSEVIKLAAETYGIIGGSPDELIREIVEWLTDLSFWCLRRGHGFWIWRRNGSIGSRHRKEFGPKSDGFKGEAT